MSNFLTVITPAESYDLTTLATVKAECGITNANDDANISRWIREASSIISAECGRVFAQETVQEVFRCSGGDYLTFERYPVSSITSVTESNDDALDAARYELDESGGRLYRLSDADVPERTWWPAGKITAVYTGGYLLLDGLPHGIERACIQMVKVARSASRRDPLLRSEDIPGVLSQSFWVGGTGKDSGAMPPDVLDLISPYRVIRV